MRPFDTWHRSGYDRILQDRHLERIPSTPQMPLNTCMHYAWIIRRLAARMARLPALLLRQISLLLRLLLLLLMLLRFLVHEVPRIGARARGASSRSPVHLFQNRPSKSEIIQFQLNISACTGNPA